MTGAAVPLVLDTNVVLDLFVFNEPALADLKADVLGRRLRWLATGAMRAELQRVLDYPHIALRMQRAGTQAAQVLAAFDASAELAETATRAPVVCKDPDDQPFIDLAVACGGGLLSKDRAVLCLARRLRPLGVVAQTAMQFAARNSPPATAASSR